LTISNLLAIIADKFIHEPKLLASTILRN